MGKRELVLSGRRSNNSAVRPPKHASDSVDSESKHGATIPQVMSLPRNVINEAADGLKRLSEQDAEIRELVTVAVQTQSILQIIPLLSHRELNVRRAGADALSKLSEQVEFRESIIAAIPQIITLLSDSSPYICSEGADTLAKLSEQAEFRESIRLAIPQMITLLKVRDSGVRTVVANALTKFSEQAEFRKSIKSAIPQMITLLKTEDLDVRKVAVNALAKLSEQAEFRKSIKPAIPQMITLLKIKDSGVRTVVANALTKLSEQAELRESIKPAIPQMIALLGSLDFDVCKAVANALAKLSEQAELRELIKPAIPQMITLLRSLDFDVCKAGANALAKFSEQAEFQRSIRPAIPQMICLFRSWDLNVCKAVANALAKLSEQAELRELIKPAIPQMITLLGSLDGCFSLDICEQCEVVANALVKLSEQAEFRESIRPAIPQMINLLGSQPDVCNVVANALMKLSEHAEFQESIQSAIPDINVFLSGPDKEIHQLPEQGHSTSFKPASSGNNADSTSDIVNSELEHSWTTTCWIAAEHALQHARSNISSVSEVFGRCKIQESEYAVHAGFDESLIKSGVGYLEQIHVFVFTEVDATSPLLPELGRLFSPFSSILFTESSSYHLPVFKDDGSVWEFDELTYFTASKFADGGASAKTPLTIISLSQIPSLADSATGFSQSSSGSASGESGESGEGEKNKKQRLEKGKGRDMGDSDKDSDKADKGSDDPEDPPGDQGGITAGLAKISFEIAAEIYPIQDEQNAFQTLTMHGGLTIETTPPAQNPPPWFTERLVQFTELTLCTKPPTDMVAYKQFHLAVIVDSQQGNAHVKVIKPKSTSVSGGEERQLSSTKSGWTCGISTGLNLGSHPQAAIMGVAMKTNEKTAGFEKTQNHSAITASVHRSDGNVSWGFNIADVSIQKQGIDMQEDDLPTVRFEFAGDSDLPEPPPKYMDIAIISSWSIIPLHEVSDSEPKSAWLHKLLRFFRSTSKAQTTSYSNLFQIVALKVDPSNLPRPSRYRAKVEVRSGVCGPPDVKRQAADSVDVTFAVVDSDDPEKLSTFNLPTIAKFRLSDNCIPVFGCKKKEKAAKVTSFIQWT